MNAYLTLKDAIYYCEDRTWELRYSDPFYAAVYNEAAWRMRQILHNYWQEITAS